MSSFKNRVTGDVVNVASWRDPDAADLRRQRVTQVIAIEIQGSDDIEIFGSRQHLLECDISNGVFDNNAGAGPAFRNLTPRPAVDLFGAEKVFSYIVAPVAE